MFCPEPRERCVRHLSMSVLDVNVLTKAIRQVSGRAEATGIFFSCTASIGISIGYYAFGASDRKLNSKLEENNNKNSKTPTTEKRMQGLHS